MKDHNKKINHFLLKRELKIVFIINQDFKFLITGMVDIRTFVTR